MFPTTADTHWHLPRIRPGRTAVLVASLLLAAAPGTAQTPDADAGSIAEAIGGLKLRGIGPALMGGRIADIAVHPERRSTWYVVVGSGGLWKTENGGATWKPIFDEYPSYSLGTVALDPSSPEVVWLGTGENVSGRHVGWGDGVYRSRNGGATWEAVGLAGSQHIGRILVDPRDGDTVLVAAEGPLWNGGGERGVYRTEDGGATWTRTLDLGPDTGVTDLEFAPGDPDTVYAAAYQRRRHVWSFLAGGPGSGIHKSEDGGRTFRKITAGPAEGGRGEDRAGGDARRTRASCTPPSRRTRRSGAFTARSTGARAGNGGTPTSREAPGRTTTRRSRRRPPTRTSCTRWTCSST